MANLFRKLHHVCIVVRDLDQAVAYYSSLGIGPWRDLPRSTHYASLNLPSEAAFRALKYKFANIDNIQFQLCEPPAEDCPQRRFLDTHGQGVFHLGFDVADCDVGEVAAKELGVDVKMSGRRLDGSGFTYFDTADRAGVIFEIRSPAKT
jgi:catechol 2,3-dioxygenase-like lactoylglutathione lyase family enzyme